MEQNEQISDVGFAQKNGMIVPVGPNDLNDSPRDSLPMPYDFRDRNMKIIEDNKVVNEDDSARQVLPEPNKEIKVPIKSSSSSPQNVPIVKIPEIDGNLENPRIEN